MGGEEQHFLDSCPPGCTPFRGGQECPPSSLPPLSPLQPARSKTPAGGVFFPGRRARPTRAAFGPGRLVRGLPSVPKARALGTRHSACTYRVGSWAGRGGQWGAGNPSPCCCRQAAAGSCPSAGLCPGLRPESGPAGLRGSGPALPVRAHAQTRSERQEPGRRSAQRPLCFDGSVDPPAERAPFSASVLDL